MATKILAGLALVKLGKILLVHPTGAAETGTWSIPKGHQEPGEPTLQAAVREVLEEVGIPVPIKMLQGVPRQVWVRGKNKVMMYWVINVDWLPIPDELPIEQLQLEEIDEARFVDLLDAGYLLEAWQAPVLDDVPTSAPQIQTYGRR